MAREYRQFWTVPDHHWDEDGHVTIYGESEQMVVEAIPRTTDPAWKHNEIRMINIIGRFLTELLPNKNFEVKTIGTLEGVKYRVGFTRGGLSDNDARIMNEQLHDISFRVSKSYGQVYHLDYSR